MKYDLRRNWFIVMHDDEMYLQFLSNAGKQLDLVQQDISFERTFPAITERHASSPTFKSQHLSLEISLQVTSAISSLPPLFPFGNL